MEVIMLERLAEARDEREAAQFDRIRSAYI
jgi:hypothetical protein